MGFFESLHERLPVERVDAHVCHALNGGAAVHGRRRRGRACAWWRAGDGAEVLARVLDVCQLSWPPVKGRSPTSKVEDMQGVMLEMDAIANASDWLYLRWW